MLDVVRLLLALALVQVPHGVVQLLHVLPLQVCVTFLLIVLYDLYTVREWEKSDDWELTLPVNIELDLYVDTHQV